MTEVTIYKNEKHECVGFKVFGHAGYGEYGQDVVCAAISVLTINTMNAIELFTKDQATMLSDEDTGMIEYHLTERPSKEATLLLKTMILGLEEMADDENYEKYIYLKFKEV